MERPHRFNEGLANVLASFATDGGRAAVRA
jgi:hypothetical protein